MAADEDVVAEAERILLAEFCVVWDEVKAAALEAIEYIKAIGWTGDV